MLSNNTRYTTKSFILTYLSDIEFEHVQLQIAGITIETVWSSQHVMFVYLARVQVPQSPGFGPESESSFLGRLWLRHCLFYLD